jgi:hypothetical protein
LPFVLEFQRIPVIREDGQRGTPSACAILPASQILLPWLAIYLILAAVSFAHEPLQINNPYLCADGVSYTILNCKPFRNDQSCTWREEKNGQEVVTAVSLASRAHSPAKVASKFNSTRPVSSSIPARRTSR